MPEASAQLLYIVVVGFEPLNSTGLIPRPNQPHWTHTTTKSTPLDSYHDQINPTGLIPRPKFRFNGTLLPGG
ncbi:unnamed protein product [Jaminaea pallidilutea]